MIKPLAFGTLLLATTQLIAPAALAQAVEGQAQTPPAPPADSADAPAAQDAPQEEVEVSAPGYDPSAGEEIVVTGRNIPNSIRATPQVLSVLSAEDIARTGEGDVAAALTRVTGLSVVGNGFVFVRGLGDRYSSSMLNGSPLPSPEPLRRAVPLDVFPTSIVGSALIQKSYSVNYPAEFGGGVINLTTRAVPEESFLQVGGSATFDTESTSEFGYVYDGGGKDWIGYDDGTRRVPAFIKEIGAGGTQVPTDQVAQLTNAQTTLLQSNYHLPVNWSGELSLGHSFDLGGTRLGIIASGGASNTFRTRETMQQDTNNPDGNLRSDYDTVLTDNRILVNGLLGLGAEFGDHKVRATTVYIHDTLKQGRLSDATLYPNATTERLIQNTNWFERQLFEVQGVGEFKFGDLKLDIRGAYAKSERNAPYERSFSYLLDPTTGAYFNDLSASQSYARVAFSELDENLYSGQADLSYRLDVGRPVTLSAGYYYSDTDRVSTRYNFEYRTDSGAPLPVPFRYLRPDHLLSDEVLFPSAEVLGALGNNGWCLTPADGCIVLNNISGFSGASRYDAKLRINAGYVQAEGELIDGLRATIGVRYEDAEQSVVTPDPDFPGSTLHNSYWLPAATLTWNFAADQQLRLHASKTLARPQFRELAPQFYRDFESDRQFIGNPNLVDTELWNFEGRYEWFFGRNERFTVAAFYKKLDNPIEQVSYFQGEDPISTTFSYAPSAKLYGVEAEVQKYIPLDFITGFETRRLLLIGNYTYTQSQIDADDTCVPDYPGASGVAPCGPGFIQASSFFRDEAPLTGQSDHLVNVQIGIEDTESLSQLTLLFNYASKRVTARGSTTAPGVFLPDVVEDPGIRIDLVARQGFEVLNTEFELKFEARNLTKTRYMEYQQFEDHKVYINRYDLGRTFSVGLSAKF